MQNSVYAKEYTERALDYIEAVARLENRFQSRSQYRWRLQAMVEGDSPSTLWSVNGGMGRQRDVSVSPVSLQARLGELDRELTKEMVHLQAVREQTWDLFSRLSHPKAGKLLEEFYLTGTPIQVIAAQTAYNERYVYRIKNQALRELGKMLMDNGIEDPSCMRGGEAVDIGCQRLGS